VIPFIPTPSLSLGPLSIDPFGLFAAVGIYFGARLAVGRAARQGLDPTPIIDFLVWGVLSGILVGHLVHLLLYHPEELRDPARVLKVWEGLSSFGGLLGGAGAAVIYFRRKGLRLLDYGDAFALGIAPGWGIARLGCFAVHDHPGALSDFPLAVAFPGGARHDLGLYDAIALFAIAIALYALARRRAFAGRLLPVLGLLYGAQRFLTDFLRASDVSYADPRYFGLTPAQYFCVLLVGWGLFTLARGRPRVVGAALAGVDPAPSSGGQLSRNEEPCELRSP
jgi:phosphatidylglycerol:prolipoprotein diacylglycerol transferase